MAKILLVEDDNNLREIYEARLQAEGYDIVSARDGEEALTVAMKERPDLIISDVMMPKISGFDMLDIIRSTEETKNVKVIMMTALSQAEDKARAEKLGADRYLVKSQVTLEDVAKVAREVLNGESAGAPTAPVAETPVEAVPVEETPIPAPVVAAPEPAPAPAAVVPEPIAAVPAPAPDPAPAVADTPAADATAPVNPALSAVTPDPDTPAADPVASQSTDEEQTAIAAQIESFIDSKKTGAEAPATEAAPAPAKEEAAKEPEVPAEVEKEETNDDASASSPSGKKIIQPISDPTASKQADLDSLLEKEKEKDQMAEIARNLATEKAGVADELSAEAALRSAARTPQEVTPEASSESEVKITEDGNLKVKDPPAETAEETPASTEVTSAPASTGTNIDGIVQPSTTPAPAKPATAAVDPDSIAL